MHAEVNAILNCVVLPLTGGTIYATQFPCPRCVQSIIQVGIRQVVYLEQKPHQVAAIAAANKMLQDAGIEVHALAELEAGVAHLVGEAGAVHPRQPAAGRGRVAARRHLDRRGALNRPHPCGFFVDRRAGAVPHHRVVDNQSRWTSATRRWTP